MFHFILTSALVRDVELVMVMSQMKIFLSIGSFSGSVEQVKTSLKTAQERQRCTGVSPLERHQDVWAVAHDM